MKTRSSRNGLLPIMIMVLSKLELCFNKVPAGTELDIVIWDVPEDQADETLMPGQSIGGTPLKSTLAINPKPNRDFYENKS